MNGANWAPNGFRLLYPKSIEWSQKDIFLFNQVDNYVNTIDSFDKARIELEQYTLPSQLIAFLLVCIKKNLQKLNVIEFGSGTGRISLPILKFFSAKLLCIDVDTAVIYKLKNLIKKHDLNADFLNTAIEFLEFNYQSNKYDTAIMNPPFGTKRRGIDVVFLRKAFDIAQSVVSIHKSNFQSRKLISELSHSYNKSCEILATVEFPIAPIFSFHKKQSHRVCVDVFRFEAT